MGRFSKDTLATDIARRVLAIQNKYKFDPGNGTAQLRQYGMEVNHKFIDRCVAYGEARVLMSLANEYDLGDLVRDKVSQLDAGWIE